MFFTFGDINHQKILSMKRVFICLAVGLITMACGSKKEVAAYKGDVAVNVPCSGKEYRSDKDHLRALGTGYATSMQIARDKALVAARAELGTQVSALMKRVTDNYASSYEIGMDEESKGKFQDLTRQVVNQELNGTIVICDETQRTQDGKFRCYVVVELVGTDLVNKVANSVKNDDKLRIDYEYEKFKEEFEKEMSKLQ